MKIIAKSLFGSVLFFLSVQFGFAANETLTIKILGINDFHGQITQGRQVQNHPVGSGPVLAAYLRAAEKGMEDKTLIAFMGDQVGASPPVSGLLNDEPTILFLNTLANPYCSTSYRFDSRCNMVATVGNHEFDKGLTALKNKIEGTDKPPTDNWYPLPHYPGAVFPYISANIVDADTQQLLFKPYVIKNVAGVKIAFIGAILKNAPSVIVPENIRGIQFLDEAESINRYIPEIKAQGAKIIVVLIHQGGNQGPYTGPTRENTHVNGEINTIVKQLDDAVDVVLAGHTHQFINAFLQNAHGKKIIVTQGNSYSSDFADITLTFDKKTQTITNKSAQIITTFADRVPGTSPDITAANLIKKAEDHLAPVIDEQIGVLESKLTRSRNGESTLGNLIADAMRDEFHADIALMNPGGIRADLNKGKVTWGDLYTVQPFGNKLVALSVSGNDIYQTLEQQWASDKVTFLQISGLSYVYDPTKPRGQRILHAFVNKQPVIRDKFYIVATNNFLAHGGDNFTALRDAQVVSEGGTDLNALINYIKELPQPFNSTIEGRIQKTKE